MKFFLSVIVTATLSLLLQLFLPWWSLVFAAFATGAAFSQKGFASFLSGLLGTALVWWGYSFVIDIRTDSILSVRIAELFQLGSPTLLIIAGGLVAGIVGGFAAVSGWALRKLF